MLFEKELTDEYRKKYSGLKEHIIFLNTFDDEDDDKGFDSIFESYCDLPDAIEAAKSAMRVRKYNYCFILNRNTWAVEWRGKSKSRVIEEMKKFSDNIKIGITVSGLSDESISEELKNDILNCDELAKIREKYSYKHNIDLEDELKEVDEYVMPGKYAVFFYDWGEELPGLSNFWESFETLDEAVKAIRSGIPAIDVENDRLFVLNTESWEIEWEAETDYDILDKRRKEWTKNFINTELKGIKINGRLITDIIKVKDKFDKSVIFDLMIGLDMIMTIGYYGSCNQQDFIT